MSPILDLRGEFDLRDRVYLDGAAHGPMPRRALAAAREALDGKRDPSVLQDREYFLLPDRVRAAAARLLGCQAEDIALATGASHGVSLVACGLDWRVGERVVVPRGEFPANSLPWRDLARRGIVVDFVDPDRLIEAIAPGTRAVAVGHVNFATGRRLDLRAIGARCAATGALFLVDASQSAGSMPLDIADTGAAVVAVAGYKWLLSPYGTGLTYVHPDWVERFRLPTFNWATIVGADDFNRLVDLEPTQRPGAVRFDVPETAAFIHGRAMAASLEFLVGVGLEAVAAHTAALVERLVAALPGDVAFDSPAAPGERSSIVRLIPAGDVASRYRRLAGEGIKVSLREGGLRVSPGIWNTAEDIDRLVDELRRG